MLQTSVFGCNRLENAVKPQLAGTRDNAQASCNRLENAVKPQQMNDSHAKEIGCNRLENAVKPQLNTFLTHANESYISL